LTWTTHQYKTSMVLSAKRKLFYLLERLQLRVVTVKYDSEKDVILI